jgi:hypothetical protein
VSARPRDRALDDQLGGESKQEATATVQLQVPYDPDLELEVAVQACTNTGDWSVWCSPVIPIEDVFYDPAMRRVVEVAMVQPWTTGDVARRLGDVALVAGVDPAILMETYAETGGTLRREAVRELARLGWRRHLARLAEELHTAALPDVDDADVVALVDAVTSARSACRPGPLRAAVAA